MAYTASRDFRPELFDDPREYEEMPLRDCKGPFPDLYRDDKKAEFIRDAIAMANTARLFGKPAYLFFGIDKHGNLQDITPDLQVYEQKASTPDQAWNTAQHQIASLVRQYITPPLAKWELKWGYYEALNKEIYLVAYILFGPLAPAQPFTAAKDLKRELSAGQCWIRIGESKAEVERKEISPDDARYCYAYAQVPYVLPSLWQAYLEGLWSDREANLPQAQQIVAYQELFVADGRSLLGAVDEFLTSDRVLLILSGTAGCGKSAFLQRLVSHWMTNGVTAIADYEREEQFKPPPEWIPVYLSLRGRRLSATWSLARDVVNKVNQLSRSAFWKTRPEFPERLLEYDDLHWLVCLDGLDEIWSEAGQRHFIEGLQTFLEEYPRVKVILTTRPDVSRGLLKTRGEVIEIAPLTPEQILRYIQNFPSAEDPERYSEIEAFLHSDVELWELCQAPAYLEAAVSALVGAYPQPLEETEESETEMVITAQSEASAIAVAPDNIPVASDEELELQETVETLEPVEKKESREERDEAQDVTLPISLGVLMERVYDHLWQREQRRHSYPPDRWTRWRGRTERLALKMDGARESTSYEQVCNCIKSKEAISRLLSLGVLKRDVPETWLRFATRLTQLYFAAAFLKPYLRQTADHAGARRHIKHTLPDFRQRLLEILSHISNVNPYPIFQEVNDESI